jgi:diguanylate cyclase (GGDEF)-like protein/PAS domain S-box-containing protein
LYLFGCLGLVAALPVLVLGIIQVPQWGAVQLAAADREGQFVAEALALGIEQMAEGHINAVETVAGQVQAAGSLDRRVLQKTLQAARAAHTQHDHYGGFSFMYIANADGISIAAEPAVRDGRPTAGTNYSNRDYYQELIHTYTTTISRIQVGKNSGVPNVQIAAPIWDQRHKMVGFAEGSLDLGSMQRMADRLTGGLPGLKAAVLDHEGRVIVHPDARVRAALASLSHLQIFQKPVGKTTAVRTGPDESGNEMRAYVVAVKAHDLDWTVSVYQPQADVQTEAAAARKRIGIIAGLALLTGLAVATLLAGALSRPIRKLADSATAVGGGDFSQVPANPGSFMPREMASLQLALRNMTFQLEDYTQSLEKRIEERTRQLSDANREIQASEAKFRALVEQSVIGVCILRDGKFAYVNTKLVEMLGYSERELLAMGPVDVTLESHRDLVIESLRKQQSGEAKEVHLYSRGRRKNGSAIDLEIHSSRLDLGNESLRVSIAMDVTDRLRAEREVKALQTELREQSIRDALTGLYNRRYLDEIFERELSRAARSGQPVSVIMGDLDHFKAVNDTYGHRGGDDVLRVFGQLVARNCRGSDIACRYGGEEFMLLLPEMSGQDAYARAEQLRLALAGTSITHEGSVIRVTASFGVATFPQDGKTRDALVSAVDEALYTAKKAGRNRTIVFDNASPVV